MLVGAFWASSLHAIVASGACPVLLAPSEADEAWKKASLLAEKHLGEHADAPQDCRSVSIEVQREGNALLTFTTVDGRIAVRLLHAPEDIIPTLEALLVTLPVAPPASPTSPSPEPTRGPDKPPDVGAPSPRFQARHWSPVVSVPTPRFLFGVSVGGRWGIDEMLFGPTIQLRGSYELSAWELGVRAEYAPTYSRLVDGDPQGFQMYSLAASIAIGRRETFSRFAIPIGITMGLAGVHEAIDSNPTVKGDINLDTFEPLVGTYLGLVMPERGLFRFSLGLGFDVALVGLKDSAAKARGLPTLPRFGLGLSMGMEVWP